MRKLVRVLMVMGMLAGAAVMWPGPAGRSVLADTSPLATPTRISPLATPTRVPATATRVPSLTPASTHVWPTATPSRTPTVTLVPPTATSSPTAVPPTATASPSPTTAPSATPVPPTATQPPPTLSRTPIAPTATGVPGPAIVGYHVVRSGETLYCIARAYVVLPSGIASANGIPYPYAVRVGQSLAISNAPWKNMPGGPTCEKQFTSACRLTHVVQKGDTLYSIAARYQTTVWVIMTDNHITNPGTILPGQKLCIR